MERVNETILSKISYFAKHSPDKICLIDATKDEQVSYASFWSRILKFAQRVQSGRRYILRTRQTIAHLVAFYGIQAAGSIAIPVETSTSDERIDDIVNAFNAEILLIDSSSNLHKTSFPPPPPPDPEKISCVICTTGTTGKSKGVLSSFRCRFCGADNVRHAYEISPRDVALVPQVLSHSGGLRRVEAMLISGATAVILGPAMFFGDVFGAIRKYHCNILQFVPAQVAQILGRAEKMLVGVADQLRIVSVGSAVIPEHDKERLRSLLPGVRLFNDFGSTEAIGSAYFEWSAYPPKPNCIGMTGIHSRIVFLDENGLVISASSPENPGQIATEGATLMSGYLNEPNLTEEVMRDGRVLSSDLGYMGEDGLMYILGRKDDIIVCGGNKISPMELEEIVGMLPDVKECACVPKPDRVMGQMPTLFIVWEKEVFPVDQLREFLGKHMDKFKIPRTEHIYTVDKLPRAAGTGKVLKHCLAERWGNKAN